MILARYSQRFTKLILLKRSIKHRYFDYLSNYNTLDLFECLYKNFEVNYWEKSKRSLAAWLCGRQPIHFAASKPFLLQYRNQFLTQWWMQLLYKASVEMCFPNVTVRNGFNGRLNFKKPFMTTV